jgi:hypothetical protein
MISTNRIFESAHGPEIPNFLEIVAGLYSIGLPRRLGETLHTKKSYIEGPIRIPSENSCRNS